MSKPNPAPARATRKALIDGMRESTAVTPAQADGEIYRVFCGLRRALREEKSVRIEGFGTFRMKLVPQRNARNPKTGEPVVVREHHKIVFKPAKRASD